MARNPFPLGWKPSRLDQGWDGTFKTRVVSPVWGKVVYSVQRDPGFGDGGYIAIRRTFGEHEVYYFAEGISPSLSVGAHLWPGRQIGSPKANPYNGIPGNIEWGRANPNEPKQPLAQVVSDPRRMVMRFYSWARSLGLPAATSTSGAGFP